MKKINKYNKKINKYNIIYNKYNNYNKTIKYKIIKYKTCNNS